MSFPEIDPISLLMDQGVITAPLLQAAHIRVRAHGETLNAALIQIGACTEVQMARAVAQAHGMRFEDLDGFRPPPELVVLVPEDLAQEYVVVPLRMQGNRMVVAVADLPSPAVRAALTEAAGLPVEYVVSARAQICEILNSRDTSDFDEALAGRAVAPGEQLPVVQEQSAIRALDHLITDAVRAGATDIHLRPDADGVHVRFRLDGKLRPKALLPLAEGLELVSCLKLMAGLDLSEAREMQEGSAGVTVDERDCGLRVSTLPGLHGDAVFVRVASHQVSARNLDTLGLGAEHERRLRALLQAQQGVLLVTGFPGSGKSSTLYALLSAVNDGNRDIVSVEDPVEVRLSGIAQVGVDEASGATFPKLLTAMMSEGADVIGISDLRDDETARLAVTAAERGELVIGAIHAPSATAALLRFVQMSGSVAAAQVNAVIAQQLLGRVCEHCAIADDPDRTVRQRLEQRFGSLSGASFRRGAGCPVCDNLGIIGTVPIYELLLVDERLRRMVVTGSSEEEVRAEALRTGFRSLEQDAFARAVQGLVPVEEVMRVRGAASTPVPIARPTVPSASQAAVVGDSQGAREMTRDEQTVRPVTPGSRARAAAAEPVLRVRQQPANVGLLAGMRQRGWLAPAGWGLGLAAAAGLLVFAINNPIRLQPAGSAVPKLAAVARRPDPVTRGSGGSRTTPGISVVASAPPRVQPASSPGGGAEVPDTQEAERASSGAGPRVTPGSTDGQQTGAPPDAGTRRTIATAGASQPVDNGQHRITMFPPDRPAAAQPDGAPGIQGDSRPSGSAPRDPVPMRPGGNASAVGVSPEGTVPGGVRIAQSAPPGGYGVSILPSREINALANGGALRGGARRQGAGAAPSQRNNPRGAVARPGLPGYAGAVNAELLAELEASRERERALRQTIAEQRTLQRAYRRLEAQIAEVRRNPGGGTVPANQPLNSFGAGSPTTVFAGAGGPGGSTTPPSSAPGGDFPPSGNSGGGGSLEDQIRAQVVIGSHGDFYFFERVPISLTIQNIGKSTTTIRFQPGERYDFEIFRGDERVWSWMESRGVTPASTPLVLRPKQKQVYRATWDQKGSDGEQVPPGWYTLRVTISAMDQWQKKGGQPVKMRISTRFQIVGPR